MDFAGYKTYIIAGATILYALGGLIIGKVDFTIAIPLILGALGVGGLRQGIAKSGPQQVQTPQPQ